MNFTMSEKQSYWRNRVVEFMNEHVYPAESRYWQEIEANTQAGKRWTPLQTIEQLKPKARAAGLWNLFLPESQLGAGLTNQEYAPQAELIPVYLHNLNRAMPKGVWLPLPVSASVLFGAPVEREPAEDKAAFLTRARGAMLDIARTVLPEAPGV